MKFTTESGTQYEIDEDRGRVRRVPSQYGEGMRKDEQWIDLQILPDVTVNQPCLMILAPLGQGDATMRRTTIVTSIDFDATDQPTMD